MDIDNEVLIALVFERASLWDKKNKFYSNRNVTDKSWKEISSEMKQDENKLRKRWRYLRDQFAVEFGKIPPSRSGDEATSVCPKWPYFKSLLFLKDVVKPRSASVSSSLTRRKSLPSPVTDQGAETADNETRSSTHDSDFSPLPSPRHQEDDHESGQPSTASMSISQPTPQQIKRPKKSINDQILHIEQQKLKLLQEKQKSRSRENQPNEDNEHFLFFKSLIPHIDKIPQHMVLSFRNRIQSVVEEFAYTSNPLYNRFTHSSISNYSYLSADDSRNSSTPPNTAPPLNPSSTQSQGNQNLAEFYCSETNLPPPPNTAPPLNPSSTQSQGNQNLAEFYCSETNLPPPPNTAPPLNPSSTQSQGNQNLAEFYCSETNLPPPPNTAPPLNPSSTQSQGNQNLAEFYCSETNLPPPPNTAPPLNPSSTQSQGNQNLAELYCSETNLPPPPNTAPPLNPSSTQSQGNQNLAEFYCSETNLPPPPNTASIPNPSTQSQDNQNLAEFYSTYKEI